MLKRKSRFDLTTDRMASIVTSMSISTELQSLIGTLKDELTLTNQRAKDATTRQDEIWYIMHASNLRSQIVELEKDLVASKTFSPT